MKSYYHPASTTSRPLMLFAAENGLDIDFRVTFFDKLVVSLDLVFQMQSRREICGSCADKDDIHLYLFAFDHNELE